MKKQPFESSFEISFGSLFPWELGRHEEATMELGRHRYRLETNSIRRRIWQFSILKTIRLNEEEEVRSFQLSVIPCELVYTMKNQHFNSYHML
jgi:hypothetical protein